MASVKRLDAERDHPRLTAWRTDNPWPTARKG